MKRDITLTPSMGPEIVKHLRRFGALPENGFLAGQAVDSAITDLWLGGGGVYNDLDIFRRVAPAVMRMNRVTQTADRFELLVSEQEDYTKMQLALNQLGTYNIQSVNRMGMLNYVNITSRMSRDQLTPYHVLAGFDLNCVRVGVDLATKKLVWDRNYAEFLRTRQLKTVMMHTPAHTYARLCRKLSELPAVYADLEIEAMAGVALLNGGWRNSLEKKHVISLLFGKKMHSQMLAQSEVFKHFNLLDRSQMTRDHKNEERKVELWTLESRSPVASELQKRIDKMGLAAVQWGPAAVREHFRVKSPSVNLKLQALIDYRQKVAVAKDHFGIVHLHANLTGTAYVKGQALASVSDKVEEFLSKHKSFAGKLVGLSLAEQAACIQTMQKLAAEYGKKYWEGDNQAALGVLETVLSSAAITREDAMRELIEQTAQYRLKPFNVKPLALPGKKLLGTQVIVQELLSEKDLAEEGKELKHCVAGYGHSVRQGRCRILRIRTGRDKAHWSTVELRQSYLNGPYTVAQHRGFQNQAPAAANVKALSTTMLYLNYAYAFHKVVPAAWILKTEYHWNKLVVKAVKALSRLADAAVKALKVRATRYQAQAERTQSALTELDALSSSTQASAPISTDLVVRN